MIYFNELELIISSKTAYFDGIIFNQVTVV